MIVLQVSNNHVVKDGTFLGKESSLAIANGRELSSHFLELFLRAWHTSHDYLQMCLV
jgi:hypothetical protein